MNRVQVKNLLTGLSLPLIAALMLLSGSIFAAQPVYITLEINGNRIDGDSTVTSFDRENTIEAFSFGLNVNTPRDVATGGLTGRRQYRPITFLKRYDKATPLLLKALALNEPVTRLEARFFRASPVDGAEQHYFTITLENGFISSINQVNETPLVPTADSNLAGRELISVVFDRITMTYENGGVTHTDDWRGQ